MPRAHTTDEVRYFLLEHVHHSIHYWDSLPNISTQERLEGLAFTILSMLDGSAAYLPGFIVAPDPHPTDQAYYEDNEENWFPENHETIINSNIGGSLHEFFHSNPRPPSLDE